MRANRLGVQDVLDVTKIPDHKKDLICTIDSLYPKKNVEIHSTVAGVEYRIQVLHLK